MVKNIILSVAILLSVFFVVLSSIKQTEAEKNLVSAEEARYQAEKYQEMAKQAQLEAETQFARAAELAQQLEECQRK